MKKVFRFRLGLIATAYKPSEVGFVKDVEAAFAREMAWLCNKSARIQFHTKGNAASFNEMERVGKYRRQVLIESVSIDIEDPNCAFEYKFFSNISPTIVFV